MVTPTGGQWRLRPGRLWGGLALALVVSLVLAPAALAGGGPNLTWTGKNGLSWWSRGGNWSGSAPKIGSTLGYLTFGDLGSACDSGNTYDTCYLTTNNLSNLSVHGIKLDDSLPYVIAGRAFTLGAGGITATAGAKVSGQTPVIAPALTLSAYQTWSIQGGSYGQGLFVKDVSGTHGLVISLPKQGDLYIDGAVDVGNVSVSDSGGVVWLDGSSDAAKLNSTSGSSVTLRSGTALVAASIGNETGPLISDGGLVQAGIAAAPEGTLAVQGALTLNSWNGTPSVVNLNIDQPASSPTPGTDFSQLTATGNSYLTSADLHLYQGLDAAGGCENLHAGDAYPIIKSGGPMESTFLNAGSGTIIKVSNNCNGANRDATAKLTYTGNAVVATIVSAGNAGELPVNTALPKVSGKARQGAKLSASKGSWTHSPTSYRYQWLRCTSSGCKAILGANHHTYIPTARDAGHRLEVDAEAVSGAGYQDAYSAETAVIPTIGKSAIKRALARALSLPARAEKIAKLRRSHGHRFTFRAPSGGKLVIQWHAWVVSGHHSHKRVIAKVTSRKTTRGKRHLKLKLTKAGRAALAHTHSLKVTAIGSFTPTGGRRVKLSEHLKLH